VLGAPAAAGALPAGACAAACGVGCAALGAPLPAGVVLGAALPGATLPLALPGAPTLAGAPTLGRPAPGLNPIATVRCFFGGTEGGGILSPPSPDFDSGRIGAFGMSCVPGFLRWGGGGGATDDRSFAAASATSLKLRLWALLTASGETCGFSPDEGGCEVDVGPDPWLASCGAEDASGAFAGVLADGVEPAGGSAFVPSAGDVAGSSFDSGGSPTGWIGLLVGDAVAANGFTGADAS